MERGHRIGSRTAGLVLACALAAAVAVALVGAAVVLHPGRGIVGSNPSSDFQIMTWSLAWWPWAIRHGVDPLHTPLLWPPHGFSTLWMTTVPVPALLGLPLTLTAGPLVAYNVLMLAAVVLATASAYLLCFELTGRAGPSLLGGAVFGLSPYMLGHTLSEHLDLTFVFPLPLLALLVVRHQRGRTSGRRLVAGWAVLLLVLAGSSLELFVDLALLLAVTALLALALDPAGRRAHLRLAGLVALAYAACLPVLAPVAAVGLAQPHGAVEGVPSGYAVDLLNVLVPTPTLLAGTLGAARSLSSHFVGNIGERDGYVGLPLLAVSLLALRTHWRRGAWAAGLLVAVAFALSLGPTLEAGGRPLLTLPLSAARLPVAGNALPARMSVFASLGLACLCALWFAWPRRRALELSVAALLVASLLPAFSGPRRVANAWGVSDLVAWSTPRPPAGFTADPGPRGAVAPGSTVLVLPTRDRTASSYWQAASGMRFRLAVPETPFLPPAVAAQPTVVELADNDLPAIDGTALAAARLRAYLAATGVGAVVATPAAGRSWRAVVRRAVPVRPARLPAGLVFRVPPSLPPLRATGEDAYARGPAASVHAWLAFDGARARLRVALRRGAGPVETRTLSAPGADAEEPAVAVGPGGEAAVAFLEWRDGLLRLRAATTTRSGWRVATLAVTRLPVWSPQVAVTRSGAVVAAWIEERDPIRTVQTALLEPGGAWRRPAPLDVGDGIGALGLRSDGRLAIAAWHDSLANEGHVRAATFDGSRWRTATLASSLDPLEVIVLGPAGRRVRWRVHRPGRRPLLYEADRRGLAWGRAYRR